MFERFLVLVCLCAGLAVAQPVGDVVELNVMNGADVYFANGEALPEGKYKVQYIDGAFRRGAKGGRYYNWDVDTVRIRHSGGKEVWGPCTADYKGYATQHEAEKAHKDEELEFHHSGGKISVNLWDEPYEDNTPGSPSPRFRLIRL